MSYLLRVELPDTPGSLGRVATAIGLAGGNLTRDLEAVEEMTVEPAAAVDRMVDLIPSTFRVDWALRLRREVDGRFRVVTRSPAAPDRIPPGISWPKDFHSGRRIELPNEFSDLLVAACPLGENEMIVIGRRGGPVIIDSEIARLSHMASLASSIASSTVS